MTEMEKQVFCSMSPEEKLEVLNTIPSDELFSALQKRQRELERKLRLIVNVVEGTDSHEATKTFV